MRVVQVNLGRRTPLKVGGRDTVTGIFKQAVTGCVPVESTGLKDDAVCDGRHHGGPDQAVYLYASEDYGFWSRQLGKEVPAGAFGENLTTEGLDLRDLAVGDLLRSPQLCLQVTAPRIPCNTLATRMGDTGFVKKFVQAARSGAYCRVLEPGRVTAGDTFSWEKFSGERILLATFFADNHRQLDPDTLRRYLAAPIDVRSRLAFEKQLARHSA